MSLTAGTIFVMSVLIVGVLMWLWVTAILFNGIVNLFIALYYLIEQKLTTPDSKQKEQSND